MSAATLAEPPQISPAAFSPRTVLALVLIGVLSFSALAGLYAYAPDLRTGDDGGAHALSKSAVGFAGAVLMIRAQGAPVVVSRSTQRPAGKQTLLILTPPPGTSAKDLASFDLSRPTLIVLPKWFVAPDPRHSGWVKKVSVLSPGGDMAAMLKSFGPAPAREVRASASRVTVRGVGAVFPADLTARSGPIDRLQTLSGGAWRPVLVDEGGRMLVAQSTRRPAVFLLAEPDLLDTQGLANFDTALIGVGVVQALRPPDAPVAFDVTLNGFARGRSLLRLMLEPPLLGATSCALAAALLAGLHALARFGPSLRSGRVLALGNAALVDSTAALVGMSGKEAQLAPAYAEQVQASTARAVGLQPGLSAQARSERLGRLARARGSALDLEQLVGEAGSVRTPPALLSLARRLHQWRLETTRERD